MTTATAQKTAKFVPNVLATFRSDSNPSKSYEIRLGRDGVVYCTCPAWKFSSKKRGGHTCKHLTRALSLVKGMEIR